jgi:hypothetical protein
MDFYFLSLQVIFQSQPDIQQAYSGMIIGIYSRRYPPVTQSVQDLMAHAFTLSIYIICNSIQPIDQLDDGPGMIGPVNIEELLVPKIFVAVTLQVYVTPLTKPSMLIGEDPAVAT